MKLFSNETDSGKPDIANSTHPLQHLTRYRPRDPRRRLPSRNKRRFFCSGNSFVFKEGDFKDVLLQALKDYKNQSKEGDTTSRDPGWFSTWRHGSYGQDKAEAMEEKLKKVNSLQEVIGELDEFFTDRSTRFHNHSLASYLLDALNSALENKAQSSFRPGSGEHCSQLSWCSIKKQLEKDLPKQVFSKQDYGYM